MNIQKWLMKNLLRNLISVFIHPASEVQVAFLKLSTALFLFVL